MRQAPFFSVIIPTYNRPDYLSACLESLAHIDYPCGRFEVIVVDDGSKMPPHEICAAFRDRLSIKLLAQPHAGQAAARNAGSHLARGEFLAFTDDDCLCKSDWLRQLEHHFITAPQHLIGGRTLNLLHRNPFSRMSQLILDVVYDHYNRDANGPRFFASNNFAVPRAIFIRLGGFDARFKTAEDRELCDRWLRQGYRMTYAPEAVVYHAHSLTLASFWRQHYGYGRGAFRFHQVRNERDAGSFRPEWDFYLRWLRIPFSREYRCGALVPMIVLWQMANAAGFCSEWFRSRREPPESPGAWGTRESQGVEGK